MTCRVKFIVIYYVSFTTSLPSCFFACLCCWFLLFVMITIVVWVEEDAPLDIEEL